jgi:regulator of protease activity HflC (stomatin/prohibitin superfamily)
MVSRNVRDAEPFYPPRRNMPLWAKRLILAAALLAGLWVLVASTWRFFFWYVPPGEMLVVIAKTGEDLPPGQVIAGSGQKGIQEKVLGEGWHYLTPLLYTAELQPCQKVEPGQVGVVTAKFGKPRGGDRILAEDDEEGIRRRVLLPGTYRLNPYAYKVDLEKAQFVSAGHVGVVRRKQKAIGKGQFGENAEVAGILEDPAKVLQPGVYPINPEEYEIVPCEVGVDQLTYHRNGNAKGTAIELRSRKGQKILLDCTIEWEVKPESWPGLLASVTKGRDATGQHTHFKTIEDTIVHQNAEREAVEKGRDFDTEDFLEGEKRLEFQTKFQAGLEEACKRNNVVIRHAFIRDIVIPEAYLTPKREKALAEQRVLTSKALAETAKTEAEVQKAEAGVTARKVTVEAETERMLATVEAEITSVRNLTLAKVDQLKAEYKAKIAEKEADAERELGTARAEAEKLVKTAESSLHKMKLDVFKGDGDAYLRYTMAQGLNPALRVRVFQSGPGTFWTNMGDKSMNLMLPVPTEPAKGR